MSSSSVRSRTRKSPATRSAEILDAAIGLARQDGLTAVTLRAVAERAGVAPALIAHYHPGMDELVARVFAELVGEELDELAALVADSGPAATGMAALLGSLLDGSRTTVTVVWVESWALGRRNQRLAAAVREQMRAWSALLADLIVRGEAEGAFRVGDPATSAWQLLGMIDGTGAQSLVGAGGADDAGTRARFLRTAEAMLGAAPGALG